MKNQPGHGEHGPYSSRTTSHNFGNAFHGSGNVFPGFGNVCHDFWNVFHGAARGYGFYSCCEPWQAEKQCTDINNGSSNGKCQ